MCLLTRRQLDGVICKRLALKFLYHAPIPNPDTRCDMPTTEQDTTQVGYIARHAKCLFRKSVWQQFASIVNSQEDDASVQFASIMNSQHSLLQASNTFSALQHANWNVVERARQQRQQQPRAGLISSISPVCVVLFRVDMTPTSDRTRPNGWSSEMAIAKIVTKKRDLRNNREEHTHYRADILQGARAAA